MKKLLNIKIELSSKNIIAEYYNDEIQQSSIRGFSPENSTDWDDIELEEEIIPYKLIAWADFNKPIAEEQNAE